jgi:hypothetical protein
LFSFSAHFKNVNLKLDAPTPLSIPIYPFTW